MAHAATGPTERADAVFEVVGLSRQVNKRTLFSDLSLYLTRGETLVVHGPSGCGKTQLLRMLAQLDPTEGAEFRLRGQTPAFLGFPVWRSRVLWVPQRAPILSGTPQAHAQTVADFASQRARDVDDPRQIGLRWGLPVNAWNQPWSDLSGGEAQRALLAIAVSRRPDVLLLDEPTSNLDAKATLAVERTLACHTVIWVTHDAAQINRVADRTLALM